MIFWVFNNVRTVFTLWWMLFQLTSIWIVRTRMNSSTDIRTALRMSYEYQSCHTYHRPKRIVILLYSGVLLNSLPCKNDDLNFNKLSETPTTCLDFNSREIALSFSGSLFTSHLSLVQELGLIGQLYFTKHDCFTVSVQPVPHISIVKFLHNVWTAYYKVIKQIIPKTRKILVWANFHFRWQAVIKTQAETLNSMQLFIIHRYCQG